VRDRTVAVLGLGKTVDGDFLSSDDVELLFTIAGYVAIALDNAQLYSSLEQKAVQIERLKDFSENIVESLSVGVLTVDIEGRIESWNTQLENLIGVSRQEALGRKLSEVLPQDLVAEIASRIAGAGDGDLQVPAAPHRKSAAGQRFDHPAGQQDRRAHRAVDPAGRRDAARTPARADDPE
jgi:PAS domain S-box-containing protein